MQRGREIEGADEESEREGADEEREREGGR